MNQNPISFMIKVLPILVCVQDITDIISHEHVHPKPYSSIVKLNLKCQTGMISSSKMQMTNQHSSLMDVN